MKIHITQHSKNQENLTKSPGTRQSRDDNPEVTQMLELADAAPAAAVLVILHEAKPHSLEKNGRNRSFGKERRTMTITECNVVSWMESWNQKKDIRVETGGS